MRVSCHVAPRDNFLLFEVVFIFRRISLAFLVVRAAQREDRWRFWARPRLSGARIGCPNWGVFVALGRRGRGRRKDGFRWMDEDGG